MDSRCHCSSLSPSLLERLLQEFSSIGIANSLRGKYDYRLITGGVGHNIPQEAPQAFAKAVVDVDGF